MIGILVKWGIVVTAGLMFGVWGALAMVSLFGILFVYKMLGAGLNVIGSFLGIDITRRDEDESEEPLVSAVPLQPMKVRKQVVRRQLLPILTPKGSTKPYIHPRRLF